MLQTDLHEFDLESAIIQELTQVLACTCDELRMRLPLEYSLEMCLSRWTGSDEMALLPSNLAPI